MPVLLLSVLIKVAQVIVLKYLPTGSRQTSAQNPTLAPHFSMTYKDLIYSSLPLLSPFVFPVSWHIYICSSCFTHTGIFHLCFYFRTLALTLFFVSEALPSNTYRAVSSLPPNSSSHFSQWSYLNYTFT